jgi:hypothetical protein
MKAVIYLLALLGLFITTGCAEHEHHEDSYGGSYEDRSYSEYGHGDYRDQDYHDHAGYNDYR